MEMLVMMGVLFIGMYFLMIRPQKKKQQEQQAMITALGEGDRVMLTSGIFATIKHLGEEQAIVELSPGNDVTILRRAIMRGVKDDEDEFEYAEDAEPNADAVPVEVDVEVSPAESGADAVLAEEIYARPSEDPKPDDFTQNDRGSSAI